jgi:hypothetical protein
MEGAAETHRGRWRTAIGLTLAVVLLAVSDALPLVALPLAVLLLGLPGERQSRWFVAGAVLLALGMVITAGGLATLSRAWALSLGALFLAITWWRPDWGITSRGLIAVAACLLTALGGYLATGDVGQLDAQVRAHFATVSSVTVADLQTRMPDATWVAELGEATQRIAEVQAQLFVALLALQSLAALGLASWWVRRLGRSESPAFALRPLSEFRFNDQLIWVLIVSVVLLLLQLHPTVTRVALNALVFMIALYTLRGLAVFVFLAAQSRSVPTMVFGVLALLFLYPVAFTAALLIGVGDTWLDVRRRAALARPT